jgi:hypothetical protein
MKTFLQWAEDRGYAEIAAEAEKMQENTKRSGIRGAYPEGYVRSQYPDLYFTPIAADAPVQLKNAGKR